MNISDPPLLVLVGPTASGKSALALHLAERFSGEIVSCDSVAVYREMEIGTAKPSRDDRDRVPHHLLDIVSPDEPFTAGDWSRLARESIAGITGRDRLPIIAGGTGLYLRALLDGLFPSLPTDPGLRDKLRSRSQRPGHLHRLLARLDPAAATLIHANDHPKLIRAIEVSLTARQPLTEQWKAGRDALSGYSTLRLGLAPARSLLYDRINRRAAEMFDCGLIEETQQIVERFGEECRPLTSLGYAEALAVLKGTLTRDEAVAEASQGHRKYAKRQGTWFRREPDIHWLAGVGSDPGVLTEATALVTDHLLGLR